MLMPWFMGRLQHEGNTKTSGSPAEHKLHHGRVSAQVMTSSSTTRHTKISCSLSRSCPQLSVTHLYPAPRHSSKSHSSKFIITGDFNIDVLDHTDPLTQRLRDILNSFGLIWSVNMPTPVTATSSKAIDNVITNIPNASVTVFNAANSDHFAQETTISNFEPEIEHPSSKIKSSARKTLPFYIFFFNICPDPV
ncbi:hypothetical protein J6590_068170 [Homalodisca vitripennis]|nr:hypothetical protein J6590_068170 [Homalodisca vitripennis]